MMVQRVNPRIAAIVSQEAPSTRRRLIWQSCALVQTTFLGMATSEQNRNTIGVITVYVNINN
jgi:hypothetical protein